MTDERSPLLQKTSSNPQDLSQRKKWTILIGLWLGVFLGAADSTCVATMMTGISDSFSASNESSWTATSYLLTLACFTPLYGRLSDIWGRRAANLLALFLFGIGTLGSGLARSMPVFIAMRSIAGMGAGGMMSVSSIVATDLTPLKDRGFVQGIANLFYGLGAGIGAPIGGLIADTLGWRFAFLIQIPVVAISFILVSLLVNYQVPGQGSSQLEKFKRIDYLGSLTLILSVGGLLISMSYKTNEQKSWNETLVWAPFLVFAIFLLAFLYVETYVSREPVLPMRLLKSRSPPCILACNFLGSAIAYSVLYYWPMYFEAVKLSKSAEAGYHLIPYSIALSAGSLGIGIIIRRTAKFYWACVASAAITVPTLIAMSLISEKSTKFEEWGDIIPAGLGIGAITTALLVALISAIPREDMAAATGMSYLFRYTGQVTGVALSSAVMQSMLSSELRKRITGPHAAELIEKIRHTASVVRDLPEETKMAAIQSYKASLKAVFLYNLGLSILLVLLALPIKEYPLPGSEPKEAESEQEA